MPAALRRLLALPLLTLTLLAATVALGPVPSASAVTSARTMRASDIAVNQLGDPYRYGAAGPNAFDCSGLLYYSFRQAGVSNIPRTSSAQARFARRISKSSLRRGDLMFFTNGGGVYHAGMFLRWESGRALMLHSPGSGKRVRRDLAWTSSWFAGTLRG